MEENQNGFFGQSSDLPDTTEDLAIGEPAPVIQQEAEQPTENGSSDGADAAQSADAPTWAFGAAEASAAKEKRSGKVAFFAIFTSVLAICLALLILLLFVGENGIRIIRTLYTERVIYVRDEDGTSGLLTPQEAADVVRRSTVTVSVKTQDGSGIGSGFVYDVSGHICTNYHVIEGATEVQVILSDGSAYNAEVVGYDAASDLAVLRVQASGLVPVELGTSSELLVGDEVVAVGTPANMMLAGTATFGRVSHTSRLLPLDDSGDGVYEKKIWVIQTDTSVNPGNSGGPMADMYGRVVGVVVRKILSYQGSNYEGIGFAIPIDGARIILDAIIKHGAFTGNNPLVEGRSLLGVTGHPAKQGMWYCVDPDTNAVISSDTEKAGYHYAPVDGIYVLEAQGAYAKGKIIVGDVILAVNGLSVRDTHELITAVNCYPCGEIVSVSVWRNGAVVTVQILLDEG